MAGINTAIDLKQDGRTAFKVDSIYIDIDKENNLKGYEYIFSDEQGVVKICDYGADLKVAKGLKKGDNATLRILDEYTAIFLNQNDKYSEDDLRNEKDYYYNYNIKIKKDKLKKQFITLAKEYNKISNEKIKDINFSYNEENISLELNKNVYYELE